MAPDLEPLARVWAMYDGLAETERFVLEVGPGGVRLVFPSPMRRGLLGMAIVLLLLPFFGALGLSILFVQATPLGRASIVLLLVALLVAGMLFVGTHVWPFIVRDPHAAMDAQVTAIEHRLVGLRLRLAIRRTVPMPPYYGQPSPASGEYLEDRWVIVGSRRKILAALGPSSAMRGSR